MPHDLLTGAIEKEELIQKILAHLNGREPDISTAILIASSAFHGHPDRNGESYMIHLMQTFTSGTQSNKKRMVEILHDLVEDTVWELEDLARIGFSNDVVTALDYVTKRKDELYFDFVERVGLSHNVFGTSHLAIDAKLLNLTHNMSASRNTSLMTSTQAEKLKIYTIAYNYLVEIKKGKIPPDHSIHHFLLGKPQLYDADLLYNNSSRARLMMTRQPGPPAARPAP